MKVYTKSGDKGITRLISEKEVLKSDPRIEFNGHLDDLNNIIGNLRSADLPRELHVELYEFQKALFLVSAIIAQDKSDIEKEINLAINILEIRMDSWLNEIDLIPKFIIPGSDPYLYKINIARTKCRIVEVLFVKLLGSLDYSPNLIVFFNRMSDYFFVFARYWAKKNGIKEDYWTKGQWLCFLKVIPE